MTQAEAIELHSLVSMMSTKIDDAAMDEGVPATSTLFDTLVDARAELDTLATYLNKHFELEE